MGLLLLGLQTELLVRMSVMRPTPARLVSQGAANYQKPQKPRVAPLHEGWELEPGQEWQQMNTRSHEGETGDITTMPSKELPVTQQAAHNRTPWSRCVSSRRDEGRATPTAMMG